MNELPFPRYHIKPFTMYNTDIQACKGGLIKFTQNGMTYVRFFSGQEIKDKLFMNENKCKIELELIVSLDINRWK